jgi:hypothetical protein
MMGMKKRMKRGGRTMKRGGGMMKKRMKKGGAAKKFPDLSGDGKVTKKDVLIAKGVIKKPRKKAMLGGAIKLLRESKIKKRAKPAKPQAKPQAKPVESPSKTKRFGKMGGGMMKKRMKRGGRAK